MYTYGTQFWTNILSEVFVAVIMAYAVLPVFYNLHLTSTYEYLNVRFSNTIRLMGTTLFLIKMLLYIPMVIYVPALAFSQVTGINIHLITPLVCVVCIFYTTLGGLKAVVWTDTIQTVIMFGALIITVIIGTTRVGGIEEVWRRNLDGGRIEFFNMDIDPTIRHSFWTVTIGNFFYWLASCSINQAMVQRCLAMPTLNKARITIAILVIGLWALVSMCCYMGLVIYAHYNKCDPITRGWIHKSDQLLPYFIMDIARDIPGLPGLFVSGVFSAALSSMSTGLNSMTGVIFEDLIKPRLRTPLSEAKASLLMKIIVVLIGLICVALVFVVEKMGALIQAAGSIGSITAGPLLGVFSLGMFFNQANPQGALIGGVLSGAFITWISVGSQAQIAQGTLRFPQKPISVEGCSADWVAKFLSITLTTDADVKPEKPIFILYRISYMYYTPIGTLGAIVIGLFVSYVTGNNKERNLNIEAFSPLIRKYLKNPPSSEDNLDLKVINQEIKR
ncbi:hypothetical protein ABEB36_003553 [Hypothenemus hampei]